MSTPINLIFIYRALWPPRIYSADECWGSAQKVITGSRPHFLTEGTYYLYFSRSDAGPIGGIYNLRLQDAEVVRDRLEKDRETPFEKLLAGMTGAGFAYEGQFVEYLD